MQNELVLAALKTATDHLAEGGTFCTKVYRSKDYNSLIWVFQQLFEDVQAIKPNSSRSQSSEIFIVCLKYTNPNRIDPKLLDPNHVFKEVSDPGLKTVDVLHKKYDKLNKRHRTGYEDGVGVLLRSFTSVSDFVKCKEPVRMLTDVNEFRFTDDCEEFRTSKFTTGEVKECFKDLRVLGKIDFKKLLKWRQQMRTLAGLDGASKTSADDDEEAVGKESKRAKKEETDESIQEEIMKLRTNALQQEKRDKKKSRLVASKERQRQALGMTNNAFGEANDMELFMIPSTSTHSQVDSIRDVDLDLEERDPTDFIDDEDEEWTGGRGSTSRVGPRGLIVKEEDELEDELESAYLRYVSGRKKSAKEREADSRGVVAGDDVQNPVTAKRARLSKSANSILSNQNEEDASTMKSRDKSAAVHGDLQAYVKMLSGSGGKKEGEGGSDDSDSDDDEFEDEEDDEEEDGDSDEYGNQDEDEDEDDDEAQVQTGGKRKLVSTDRAPKQSRIDQWFSHPVFQESVVNSDRGAKSKNSRSGERLSEQVMSAMAEIPKSDREIRKEKRKKEQERQERRGARKAAKSDTEVGILDLQIVPRKSTGNDEDDDDDVVLDEETRQKRELIKKGMGKSSASSGRQGDDSFEIAPAVDDRYPARVDGRSYDSDDEDYDNHDRATTLALGTLMLRKSRQKALVDASYNRFAWNDPRDLPSWFLDDEMRHNKPQLPIPAALIEKVSFYFPLARLRSSFPVPRSHSPTLPSSTPRRSRVTSRPPEPRRSKRWPRRAQESASEPWPSSAVPRNRPTKWPKTRKCPKSRRSRPSPRR